MKMNYEKLGTLAKNLDSKRKPLNSSERDKIRGKGTYPYIGANKIMDYVDDYLFDEEILCIAEDGGRWGANEQCSVIYTGKTWVNNHTHVLVQNKEADLRYLKYYLNYANLNKHITGATRGKLTRKALNAIKVPLPENKDDQIKIANLLTQVETLIAKREESIRLLDELIKSTFLDMFGDPIANPQKRKKVRFDDVIVLQRGFDLPKSNRNREGKIPLYGSNGIVDYHDESRFEEGIITGRSGTIGKVYYSYEPFWPLNTTLFSKDIKGNNIIYLTFLLRFFRLERFHQGAGVPTLNRNNVHKEKVYKVDRDEQDKFATIVQQVEATKAHYQDSLDELNELFGSLSQMAFKGELDLSGMKTPITVNRPDVKVLNASSRSGAGEVKEYILDRPVFVRRQMDDELIVEKIITETLPQYTDISNNPVYSKEFLWMLLKQSNDAISYESINSKLEKYSFKNHPDYNQVQTDIFALIEEKKLMQSYDDENKKIVLSKWL